MEESIVSNLRELEIFCNHSANEITHDWVKWAEKFHLTIIAKDSVDIEDVINPPQREP